MAADASAAVQVQLTAESSEVMEAMPGGKARDGQLQASTAEHLAHGAQPWHVGCLVCAGAVWLVASAWQIPDFHAGASELVSAPAVDRAPDGDWRRRLRPPSNV